MLFQVTARALNRKTKAVIGKTRTEDINTLTNQLFFGATDISTVAQTYSSFWNDLNPRSTEIVEVLAVRKVL